MDLVIENISLPEEVEKMIDRRTNLGVMNGVMDQYAKMQALDTMRDAAKNGGNNGNLTGLGVALGTAGIVRDTMMHAYDSSVLKFPHFGKLIK